MKRGNGGRKDIKDFVTSLRPPTMLYHFYRTEIKYINLLSDDIIFLQFHKVKYELISIYISMKSVYPFK